jgi:hypothetical protein
MERIVNTFLGKRNWRERTCAVFGAACSDCDHLTCTHYESKFWFTRHSYIDPAPSAAHMQGALTDSSWETPLTSVGPSL